MNDERICIVCHKPGADMEQESRAGKWYIHEACCLTEEQAEALRRLSRKFRHLPPEEH